MMWLAATMRRQSLVVGALIIGATFVAFAVVLAWNEAQDDAAISFAYAKNLAHGHGLVLSRGADPVEGYSNFLWVLAMTPAIAAGLDAILVSKIIGVLLALGCLGLLARLPSKVEGRAPNGLDLLAPALTAVALPFALWSVSGLENSLQAFLLVLVLYLSVREIEEPRSAPWSSLGFFALALNRPEGIAFWAAAAGHRGLLALLGRRRSRQDALWIMGFLLPLGMYHIWHYQYFGEFFPNTFFAKANHRSLTELARYAITPSDPGFSYLRSFFADYWLVPQLLLAPLALMGRRRILHYSLPLMMLGAGLVSILFEGGDWMPYYRFMSPLIPLLSLTVQEGIRAVIKEGRAARFAALRRASAWPVAALAVSAAVFAIAATASGTKAKAASEHPFHGEYALVEAQAGRLENLAAYLPKSRVSVLLPDIGAVAYNTDLLVIDLGGLADRYIARHPTGRKLLNYVFDERRPDIITTHEPWVKGLDKDSRLWRDYAPAGLQRDAKGNLTSGAFVRRELVIPVGSCPQAIAWEDAQTHIGEPVTVRGIIATGRTDASTGQVSLQVGTPGGPGVLIPVEDRRNFAFMPDLAYVGDTVCVTGTVISFYTVPFMLIHGPKAIVVEVHPASSQ